MITMETRLPDTAPTLSNPEIDSGQSLPFMTPVPGVACLEINRDAASQRGIVLQLKQAMEDLGIDCEMTFHRAYSNNKSGREADLVIFAHSDAGNPLLAAIDTLSSPTGLYPGWSIDGWKALYHKRVVRNNPGMIRLDHLPPLSIGYVDTFATALTAYERPLSDDQREQLQDLRLEHAKAQAELKDLRTQAQNWQEIYDANQACKAVEARIRELLADPHGQMPESAIATNALASAVGQRR